MVSQVPGDSSAAAAQQPPPLTEKELKSLRTEIKQQILEQAGTEKEEKVDFVVFSPKNEAKTDINSALPGRQVATYTRYTAEVIDHLDESQLKSILQAVKDERVVIQNITRDKTDGAMKKATIFQSKNSEIASFYEKSAMAAKYKITDLSEKFKEAFKAIANRIFTPEKDTEKTEKKSSSSQEVQTERSERRSTKINHEESPTFSRESSRTREKDRNVRGEDSQKDEDSIREARNRQKVAKKLDENAAKLRNDAVSDELKQK